MQAVLNGLQTIESTGNTTHARDPDLLANAERLASFVSDEAVEEWSIPVRQALGWFYYYRSLALPEPESRAAVDIAVDMLRTGFIIGIDDLPDALLPNIAHRAAETAEYMAAEEDSLADPEFVSIVVGLWQRIVANTPPDHGRLARYLSFLGYVLLLHYNYTGEPADLDETIRIRRSTISAASPSDADWALYLNNLGAALLTRVDQSARQADLDEALGILTKCLNVESIDGTTRARCLTNLGNALEIQFAREGDLHDIDRSVDYRRAAVEIAHHDDRSNRAANIGNLASGLIARLNATGSPADLDEAIDVMRMAVAATPVTHDVRIERLYTLSGILKMRYDRNHLRVDVDEAIEAARIVSRETKSDDRRPSRLLDLVLLLERRFERFGTLADIDEMVDACRTALARSHEEADKTAALISLSSALHTRFEHNRNEADLNESIDACRAAIDDAHADQARTHASNLLGNALYSRYEHTGDLTSLDLAIDLYITVVTEHSDHTDHAKHLSNLGNALRSRFLRTGARSDLDKAVDFGRAAVEATPEGNVDRPLRVLNLAAALRSRVDETGARTDLDEAIDSLLAGLGAIPDDHRLRSMFLNNLGGALWNRSCITDAREDEDEALTHLQAALDASPADGVTRAPIMANLGAVLLSMYERSGTLEDLNNAIEFGRAAFAASPADHPSWSTASRNLATLLRTRFESTAKHADLDDALSAYGQVLASESVAASSRVEAAQAAASLTGPTEPSRSADLLEAAVRLLPEVAPRRLDLADQQHALGGYVGLAGDAAAFALTDDQGDDHLRATRALRLLEAGRTVLLNQALDTRSDLSELETRRPDLAAQFAELRDLLDQPADTATPASSSVSHTVQDRHRIADRFTATLREIRALDGLESFALPPTADELLAEAADGPIVVFNVSKHRSDALLLTDSGITSLRLPGLDHGLVIDQINVFYQALAAATDPDPTAGLVRREAHSTLNTVLTWLWDAAAEPVLNALGLHRQPAPGTQIRDWPRLWWVPGGLLGLLPLHAAGHHADPPDDPARRTVIDRVVSSYTPTIRALRHARQRARQAGEPDRALIVAMPTTPGIADQGRLHHVATEVAMLEARLPQPVLLIEPDVPGELDSVPTKANVLANLPNCPIAHFACHGYSDRTNPSESHLLLHDHVTEPLTIASLASVRLDQAQLAYLSACQTASHTTYAVIDEAIHLTSAFQLAGFPHVVGTLWEIDDETAVRVADSFYTNLRTADGTLSVNRSAHALHAAVRAARDNLPLPFLWASYLHAGA